MTTNKLSLLQPLDYLVTDIASARQVKHPETGIRAGKFEPATFTTG